MTNSLQSFLIAARTRRGLSQQELANIAQCHIRTIGDVERGTKVQWTPRVTAMIGRALHEVERMNAEEISDMLRLTGISGAIFNTPVETEAVRDRRIMLPIIDRLIAQRGMAATLGLLHSIEVFLSAKPVEEEPEEEPPILTHVSPPKYRPDLGGTEQIITQYQAAKPKAKQATPLKRKKSS